jgi:hypothetical protein
MLKIVSVDGEDIAGRVEKYLKTEFEEYLKTVFEVK